MSSLDDTNAIKIINNYKKVRLCNRIYFIQFKKKHI